jgi:dihydropteroate synthase
MNKRLIAFLSIISLTVSIPLVPVRAAVKAGGSCAKAGIISFASSKTYTCIKSGKKLVWDKGVSKSTAVAPVDIPISIDTTRAEVAKKAVEAGADLVNDISGGTFDPLMLPTVAQLEVPIILMHLRGTPQTMQKLTDYEDLIFDIQQFFDHQIQQALQVGIPKAHLILDPGIGFAKTVSQNLDLIRQLSQFHIFELPLLVGPSRKSFIGHILQQPEPQQRVWGTAATCCAAIANGADILRVHDVAEMLQVCRMADAIWRC